MPAAAAGKTTAKTVAKARATSGNMASGVVDPATTSVVRAGAEVAFSAGWLLSQLYGPLLDRRDSSEGHLPTVSELASEERVPIALDQLDDLLGQLAIEQAGHARPTEGLRAAWDPEHPELIKPAVRALHVATLSCLQVKSSTLLTAFTLGRALSDTAWAASDAKRFADRFNRFRIAKLQGWLQDLEGELPSDAAAAVAASLGHWQIWIAAASRAVAANAGEVESAAKAQGEVWRALLAGEKDPAALLTPEATVEAAEAAVRRTAHLTWRVARHFWLALVVIALITIGVLRVVLTHTAGATSAWATIVTVAGSVGITGRTLKQTATHLAVQTEEPLWHLALHDAMGWAATILPVVSLGRRATSRLRGNGVKPARG